MAWFRKEKQKLVSQKREMATDVWEKCESCGEILYVRRLTENLYVCPECGNHFRIPAPAYVDLLLDDGFEEEFDVELRSGDPLGFVDSKPYTKRIEQAETKVGTRDAVLTGSGKINGRLACIGAGEGLCHHRAEPRESRRDHGAGVGADEARRERP